MGEQEYNDLLQGDDDYGLQMQEMARGLAKIKNTVVTVIVVLVIALLFFVVVLIGIIHMGPSLALRYAGQQVYEDVFGELPEDQDGNVDLSASEEFWYSPANVKQYLDKFFEAISSFNDGFLYITKDNFEMILDKCIAYEKSIRKVDNQYTYYHHYYDVEVHDRYMQRIETEEDDDGNNTENVNSLGARDDASTTEEVIDGPYTDDQGSYNIVTTYDITDVETTDEVAHESNKSPEDDPMFRVSWEEIYTMAAMKSLVMKGQDYDGAWETETEMEGLDSENFSIKAISRLDEETVEYIISMFQFQIGYYFDPTSYELIPGTNETYRDHKYTYEEMCKYAYIESEEGTNVEHGTEVFPDTESFSYYKYRKPKVAPAFAANAYTMVEYDYRDNGDGTATLVGRQVTIDGAQFYANASALLETDFNMDWFCDFVSLLPGSNYKGAYDSGSIADRFALILQSYKSGEPVTYYDTNFEGVGKVTLGDQCSRNITFPNRTDENGDPIVPPQVDLDITVDDITDEQIRRDIAAGLYTLEDLVYMAACIQAEAGSVDGQVAVAWCIMNRVNKKYGSVMAAVTAEGQFASPWYRYLDGSYSKQAQSVAAGVLRGAIANPIGECYYFFGAYSVWGYKPGTFHINIGGNVFYINWGDVTQIHNREGYVPFGS